MLLVVLNAYTYSEEDVVYNTFDIRTTIDKHGEVDVQMRELL